MGTSTASFLGLSNHPKERVRLRQARRGRRGRRRGQRRKPHTFGNCLRLAGDRPHRLCPVVLFPSGGDAPGRAGHTGTSRGNLRTQHGEDLPDPHDQPDLAPQVRQSDRRRRSRHPLYQRAHEPEAVLGDQEGETEQHQRRGCTLSQQRSRWERLRSLSEPPGLRDALSVRGPETGTGTRPGRFEAGEPKLCVVAPLGGA
mmetsp:Transcript_13865/g.29135  ORF Transcript_13865/g.29135 Transcript_13865/m.29135 type:complete len:200 (-) Transcript_13865:584-1183(-)